MYLVVFRSRKRADMDAATYAADAARMIELAEAQPGFLAVKTYAAPDGETVTISEWADEAAARAWGRQAEHARVQGRGRADYYESYTLFAGAPERLHRFP